jgi:hypothetical protein
MIINSIPVIGYGETGTVCGVKGVIDISVGYGAVTKCTV